MFSGRCFLSSQVGPGNAAVTTGPVGEDPACSKALQLPKKEYEPRCKVGFRESTNLDR